MRIFSLLYKNKRKTKYNCTQSTVSSHIPIKNFNLIYIQGLSIASISIYLGFFI